MSDTPRTDAEGLRFARIMIEWNRPQKEQVTELVPADFARQLERDLSRVIGQFNAAVLELAQRPEGLTRLQRYTFEDLGAGPQFTTTTDGEWIKWADVAACMNVSRSSKEE